MPALPCVHFALSLCPPDIAFKPLAFHFYAGAAMAADEGQPGRTLSSPPTPPPRLPRGGLAGSMKAASLPPSRPFLGSQHGNDTTGPSDAESSRLENAVSSLAPDDVASASDTPLDSQAELAFRSGAARSAACPKLVGQLHGQSIAHLAKQTWRIHIIADLMHRQSIVLPGLSRTCCALQRFLRACDGNTRDMSKL